MNKPSVVLSLVFLSLGACAILVIATKWTSKSSTKSAQSHSNDFPTEVEFRVPPRKPAERSETGGEMNSKVIAWLDEAFDVAEDLVQTHKKNLGAVCLLAKLHRRAGNETVARDLLNRVLKIDPNFAEAYFDLGQFELKLGNHDEAERLFQSCLAKDPRNLDANAALAESQLAQGKAGEATKPLELLVSKAPGVPEFWNKLGTAYMQTNRLQEANKAFTKALECDANSREGLYGLLSSHLKLGDKTKSNEFAARLATLDATTPRVDPNRSSMDLDAKKMEDLLVFTYQTAAKLLTKAKEVPAAISLLEKATQSLPLSNDIPAQLATLYAGVSNPDKGIQILRARSNEFPENAAMWLDLGIYSLKSRRLDVADEALRRVIVLDPKNADGYSFLSQTQMPADRDPQGSVASARKAVELSSTAENYYILGTAYYNAGKPDLAKESLWKAMELQPTNSEFRRAWNSLSDGAK